MNSDAVILALTLTLLAGLATAVGSTIAFFARRTNTRFLAMALGFSAGVMIYISFMELMPQAMESLTAGLGGERGNAVAVLAFFGGMFSIALIDRLLPLQYNPHEMRQVAAEDVPSTQRSAQLLRTGLLLAMAIALHNFPEGLATFIASLGDVRLGLPVAIAVGIHNIPEGIAVSVPIYYATGSRRLAFVLSALSGLSEPLGALLGFAVLAGFWSDMVLGVSLAAVAGIMVFISIDVLLPSAEAYGEHHLTVYALVAGMLLMALSLWLL
jgi:ZIP family zinc transporter